MTNKTSKAANGETIHLCENCGSELATIQVPVDGNNLLMHSCDRCDKRSWQLAGQEILLADALVEVKEHVSKRR